ncbi:MAG: hypothetical protein ACR2I2_08255 [Bryobacteraceae bacterium]
MNGMMKNNSAIGLDVGTSRLVAARQTDQSFQYDTQLNAFVRIPFSKITRDMLDKERVPHTVEASQAIVQGNESARFADLLNVEIGRPMAKGVLNVGEPESVNRIRELIASLVGKAAEKGQKLCFTVPAVAPGQEAALTYHEATLRQILTELGYEVKSINEGLAVVYAEMADSNYTGIGVSCGAGLCNVCLAYLSLPVMSFSTSKAGDFIDSSTAAVMGERSNRIRIIKETPHPNGSFTSKVHQVLGVYYNDTIQALVTGLKEAFMNARGLPRLGRPIPLVLCGGSTLPPGFRERFERILRETEFPFSISEIRLASEPLNTTSRGALVAALSDM